MAVNAAKETVIRSEQIYTCREMGAGEPGEVVNGFLHLKDGVIMQVGEGEVPESLILSCDFVDARGMIVTPGLVDAHTHLVHGGSRERELPMKLRGVPYLEILKAGGGILSTVRSTRQASHEELKAKAHKSLDQMLLHGTTTVEAKSGYGLDLATEVRCLEVAGELGQEHPVDIVRTYMGAHAVPEEYKEDPRGYIKLMTQEVMPFIAREGLAEFVDIFCEEGVFSPEESREILLAAKDLGFKLKLHADEIEPLGGAELAAEVGACSAEHLLAASQEGLLAMKQAGVTAVLLPGTSFYLMLGRYAQGKWMREQGLRVAIATDYNPGSCPTENLQGIMAFACLGMKLLPEDILQGMTLNAAYALHRAGTVGSLEEGKKADVVIFNVPNLDYMVYHFGINHVDRVWKDGRLVVEEGVLCKEDYK